MRGVMDILAAGIHSDLGWGAELRRFGMALIDGRIDSTDCVVAAALLLGVTCGVLGSFIVLRRQSLLGDAVGHAVLPGVCLGFIIAGGRSMPALLLGATVAGVAASLLISALQRTTVLKRGECMGAVAFGFFGFGIMLVKWIQETRGGLAASAGLDKFLFGQIASVSQTDVIYMAVIAGAALSLVVVYWRALAVSSFDESFAQSIGVPVRMIDHLLTVLLTVAIVISIQAVGVVLVAAMLVTPAATAYLLTDRLHRMTILSALFGAAAGLVGTFFSLIREDVPTGALMVLAAALLFALAFFLSPRYGLVPRLFRLGQRRRRTAAENLLRTLYIMMERRSGTKNAELATADRRFGMGDVAAQRQETSASVRRLAHQAMRFGWLDRTSPDPLILTDDGAAEARRIVRNHRLWELFLAQEAKLGVHQVHADAEWIEHVLPKDVLRRLEQMLENPAFDPHGQPIPQAGPSGGAA